MADTDDIQIHELENDASTIGSSDYFVIDQNDSSTYQTKKLSGETLRQFIKDNHVGVKSVNGGTGIEAGTVNGVVTLKNTGVTKVIAGDNIEVTQNTGEVKITAKSSASGSTVSFKSSQAEGNEIGTLTIDGEPTVLKTGKISGLDAAFDAIYPVGSIYISISKDLPPNFKTSQWERIAVGQCLFGANSSGTYASRSVGSSVQAGLPSVTTTGKTSIEFDGKEGICKVWGSDKFCGGSGAPSGSYYTGTKTGTCEISLNSGIYGKSTTVQPPALVVSMWKRVSIG